MSGVELVVVAIVDAVIAALPAIIVSTALNLLISLLVGAPSSTTQNTINGPRMSDASYPTSSYGIPIPIVYHKTRVTGALIWANQIREKIDVEVAEQTSGGGKSGTTTVSTTTTKYYYFADFAVLLCDGAIASVDQIRVNGKLLSAEFISRYVTVYLGADNQPQDPTIVGSLGSDQTPAYRGRAYLVFADVPLEDFSNRIPEVSAIVTSPIATVGGMIDDLMTRSQIASYEVDAALAATALTGAQLNEPTSIRGGLQVISAAYGFILTESDGVIKLVKGRAG